MFSTERNAGAADDSFDTSFSSTSRPSSSSSNVTGIDEEKEFNQRRRSSSPPPPFSLSTGLSAMSTSTSGRRSLRRRITFLVFLTTTLCSLYALRSRIGGIHRQVSNIPYFLPESWNDTSPFSSELDALYPSLSDDQAVVAQEQLRHELEPYFPSNPKWGHHDPNREDYKFYTDNKLRELAVCVATNTCRENQTSVVIYGFIHAHFHLYDGYMGGEGIWTMYLTETLENWGYTILRARDDWQYMWYIYNQIPDMVKGIVAYPAGQYGPFSDVMKTGKFYNGIPAWKFFPYNYFPDHYTSVVGDAWNIHSELGYSNKPRNFTFIPYIVEEAVSPPYLPTEERPYQVYIMAKNVRYFYKGAQPAWEDITFFSRAKKELEVEFPGFEFVVGCRDDRNKQEQAKTPMPVPEGVRNIGQMDKVEFERQLANSRALLGIGWPTISPSPHIALSYGIPFISPYSLWGWSSIDKPETWASSQHNTLKAVKEPYVYHVLRNDYDQFVNSIRQALRTPIPKYRLPYYTREYHEAAVSKWLNTNWKAKAQEILDNRKKGAETENGDAVLEFLM